MVIQFLTERMYKHTDPIAVNQLRQSFLQSGDANAMRGPDPVVMMLRRKVISLWQSLAPQAQLQQASQIPNGIINGPAAQSQPPSGPISTPGMAGDLNTFFADAEKLAAVNQLNQMGMRGGAMVQVRQNSDFD